MEYYRKECLLTNENIVSVVDELTEVYQKTLKKHALPEKKFRIVFEEILLKFRECYGAENPCSIVFYRNFLKYGIDVSAIGPRKDWNVWNEKSSFFYDILTRMGVEQRDLYSNRDSGRNHVLWESVYVKKKPSLFIAILIGFLLAIATGILINILPETIKDILKTDLVSPVFNKCTNIFSALATPLVFFAVICGIIGIGDVNSLGNIGSKVLKRMGGSFLIAGGFLILGCGLFYGISWVPASDTDGGSALGGVVKLVLDVIPDNFVQPFATDNDLQVIVIAIFVGVCMLLLGKKLPRLTDITMEANELVNKMISVCCCLLPILVFLGVTNIIINSDAAQFKSVGIMIIVFLVANCMFIATMIVRACIVTKTSFRKIFPKQIATIIINLATSSQVAALPENMKCCKQKFGINPKIVDFGLPLGIVVYMPSGAIFLGISAWGLLAMLGIPVTIGLAIKIMLVAIVVAIAAPPIPGSALVALPVVFASCGVPDSVYPLAVIFGTVVGYLLPMFNGFNIQLELLMTAKKLNMVDENVLQSEFIEDAKIK